MNGKRTLAMFTSSAAMALLPMACARVRVDPIEVKTIHIVHDINIKVDRELDDYFAMLDRRAAATQPSTVPATQATPTTGDVQ